jgi:hypothetical protein
MDLNFVDPSEAPVPPDEVRIRQLVAEPLPDQRRVKVRLSLTPFQQRPTVVVTILDGEGNKLASTTIIESVDSILEFTMHLRGPAPAGVYQMRAAVGYEDHPEPVHAEEISFRLNN